MRIIVFFDLPVTDKADRIQATRFRNDLVKNGYYMVQYSVYGRLCNGVDSAQSHIEKLKTFAPATGSIRCMLVTEKQYASMQIISGTTKLSERNAKYIQLSFL